ncbi:MAG: hypothetical protein ACOC36_02415, partial [Fibrobacterota bacterium]
MENSKISTVLLLLFALSSFSSASWMISADADLRYRASLPREHRGGVEALGLSVRKTIADQQGDRWILFGMGEVMDNFSMLMLHEGYVSLKGPMGTWNISAGRKLLPFGLLYNYSADRMIFHTLEQSSLGMGVDNGLQFFGVLPSFDYSVSLTQGFGAGKITGIGKGLLTSRIGFQVGEYDDGSVGFSLAAGYTNANASGHHGHHSHHGSEEEFMTRYVGSVDLTYYLGQMIIRSEISGGSIDNQLFAGLFALTDYALNSKTDLTFAANISRTGESYEDTWFGGLSFSSAWF